MPQTQTTSQSDDGYTPVDPNKNPLAFVFQNKDAIQRMPEEKQIKFVDMLFRRYALPKYQQINKQRPLDDEELDGLRAQFAARMLGLQSGPMELKDPKNIGDTSLSLETRAKMTGATLTGTGAGILGGVKTIAELIKKLDEHLGPVGKPFAKMAGKEAEILGNLEGEAYKTSKALNPDIAPSAAAVGHQIPATIASAGAEGALPAISKGAGLASKMLQGAGKGGAGFATFEASRPGGDPAQGARTGALLGTAFPFLGRLFELGKAKLGIGAKAAEPIAEKVAAPAATTTAPAAAPAAKNMTEMSEQVAQKHFKKSFKDLTSAEKIQVPEKMKEEIRAQRAAAIAEKQAAKKAAKESKEAAATAKREVDAAGASKKAEEQAKKRLEKGPLETKATAAAAVTENPSVAKHAAPIEVTKVEEGVAGKKVRAKDGEPASPAQQAADRERMAATREQAKQENFGTALEKHAQEMAGRHTSATLSTMHIPDLEAAMKEMPNGDFMAKTLAKARRMNKWSDDVYLSAMKEWMLNQFEEGAGASKEVP